MENKAIEVSIVIVCMNNLKNLYPCLNSIRKYTSVSYETFVVAYLFSKENLDKLRKDFPWVTIIESNEIRGFSENNNLALRQAKGKYCFVLNDDTYMNSPVIDNLVETIEKLSDDVVVVSPNIKYPDGRPQFCGRYKLSFWTYLINILGIKHKDSQYDERKDVFKTYNLMGAAFLIKTDIFKSVGWFDEYYFFCPEDIALSTMLNNLGYSCFVNGSITIYHVQGGSSLSVMQMATEPAHVKGSVSFYSENSYIKRFILVFFQIIRSLLRASIWKLIYCIRKDKKSKIKSQVYINVVAGLLSSKTPKELFIKYYSKIKCNYKN